MNGECKCRPGTSCGNGRTCNEQHECVLLCAGGGFVCGSACCSRDTDICDSLEKCRLRCSHDQTACGSSCCEKNEVCYDGGCVSIGDCPWTVCGITWCGSDEQCVEGTCRASQPKESDSEYQNSGNGWYAVFADAAVVVPIGAWRDSAGIGFGGLGRFSYVRPDSFGLTARTGFIGHTNARPSEAIKQSSMEIPILFGPRLLMQTFYIGFEVGPVINRVKSVNTSGGGAYDDSSVTRIRAGGTVGAGFFDVFGFMDFGVCVYSPNIYWPDEPAAIGVMLNLGVGLPIGREAPRHEPKERRDEESNDGDEDHSHDL
ncbi:MAG: hypothetical protein FWD57_02210 [Polyangiaceae bacterium]|nr:hypothetical protein [Polyangiaceae bacterium]